MAENPDAGYDALLLVAFGAPESLDEVAPFLSRVTAGRPIPPDRLAEVFDRYRSVGGRSPLNGRLRSLKESVTARLTECGIEVPVFWGNRNAPPLLTETISAMRDAGVKRALAWTATPYSSYSSCRQYSENLEIALTTVGTGAPVIDQIRRHHDHPGLVEPAAERLAEAIERLPSDRRGRAHLLFSAHSIPNVMAANCDYVAQLRDVAELVAERVDPEGRHNREVVWQSRSGPPQIPWLEPDVGDRIKALAASGVDAVAVSPIGFPVENFEIVWDLDVEAATQAEVAGVAFQRAEAVDNDPRFVDMIVKLFLERAFPEQAHGSGSAHGGSTGPLGRSPDRCPSACCPPPR